jgi:hypothetical protein
MPKSALLTRCQACILRLRLALYVNKKVCHDGTDKDDPNFDIFQDIQSQSGFSTTQLSVLGYKGDVLKAQFTEENIWKRQDTATVMVPQTCKYQEAIATANTYGKKKNSHGRQACHL